MERGKHYEKNKKRKEKKKEKLLTQEGLIEDISKSLSDIKEELENESSINVSKLNDLEIKLNSLNEAFKELEQGNEKLEQEISELKQENAEIKHENAEIKQENSEIKQENAEIKQENAEIKQENAEIKQENAEIKQQNAELKQEVAELKREVAELKQQLKIVQNELDTKKIYINYRDWVTELNFRLEIEMDVEGLYGKIVKEQMVRKHKNLPLDEGHLVSQLKEVLEKANVGFTFQQYVKLQGFRKDGNCLIHIEDDKSIDEAREELRNTTFPRELKHLKAPLYK